MTSQLPSEHDAPDENMPKQFEVLNLIGTAGTDAPVYKPQFFKTATVSSYDGFGYEN